MDTQLGDTIANRLNVSQQSTFQTFDPGHDHAAYRLVLQIVDPGGELGQRSNRKYKTYVIDRLHTSQAYLTTQLVVPHPTKREIGPGNKMNPYYSVIRDNILHYGHENT